MCCAGTLRKASAGGITTLTMERGEAGAQFDVRYYKAAEKAAA